jgi:beta-mannosidase
VKWEWASVPGGAFDVVPGGDDAEWRPVDPPARGSDDEDHWFRASVTAPDNAVLRLGGLATVCDVFLDEAHVLRSESMFRAHELPLAVGGHQVAVCARSLTPILAERRRPRARWRTRVADNNLRWLRTTLLGRAAGFAPGPPIVGPWREVELLDARAPRVALRVGLAGDDGVVEIRCSEEMGLLQVAVGETTADLQPGGGTIRVPRPRLWWPHTHGEPFLHTLTVTAEHGELRRGVGFRHLDYAADLERDGLALCVNGIPVFARGAVWTPTPDEQVRPTLERARDGGLNMIRVVGTMTYESAAFHDACDELGLLVWQDLMFANMDYPFVDERFRSLVEDEVRQELEALAGRPSTAVVCGNSEIEQQVAMLGLDPALARDAFYTERAPELVRAAGLDAAYVPSAPTGGDLPFRTDRGVANYFGVGAYLRPLEDVRRAEVRFASECLAFANVPDADPPDRVAGVMRDVGADWDFADVRDHYLRLLHGAGPDDEAYWERSRHVTGEVMAAVFGEWRRSASPCSGGIVLWLRDLASGSGWGLIDHEGAPKLTWHHLRRSLAPVAVWLVGEGLNGVHVHVSNEGPEPLGASLRISLYQDEEVLVEEVEEEIVLAAHDSLERDVEGMLGRFVDAAYAYRFGQVQQDTVVASLEQEGRVLSQAFFYPVGGRRGERRPAADLGLRCEVTGGGVRLESSRVVHGVRLRLDGAEPLDDGFDLEPNRPRVVAFRGGAAGAVHVAALNLAETIVVEVT